MFNIFFIAGAAIFSGLFLAMLVTRKTPNSKMALVPMEESADNEPAEMIAMGLEASHLFRLGESLCRENALIVKEKIVNSTRETYWVAESTNDFFYGNYVLAFIAEEKARSVVTMSDVLELKDFIKSAGGSKGFLFTTGYFTRDVYQPLEGPKVALHNRQKVVAEMRRLAILS